MKKRMLEMFKMSNFWKTTLQHVLVLNILGVYTIILVHTNMLMRLCMVEPINFSKNQNLTNWIVTLFNGI